MGGVTKAALGSDTEAESRGPEKAAAPSARQRAVHRQEPHLCRRRAVGPTHLKARPVHPGRVRTGRWQEGDQLLPVCKGLPQF